MSRGKALALVFAIGVGIALALGARVALTAPDTSIPWPVFGSGGSTASSSASYQLGSTAGQTAIGPAGSAGFQLGAGFWYGLCVAGSVSDDDCDGYISETPCGSNPGASTSTPERIDGAFASVDDDGDGSTDEALPAGAANFDCDGDGYTGAAEGGTPLCGNAKNDDDKTGVALLPDDAVIDDGCPGGPAQVGSFSEAQFFIGLGDQDPCGLNGWPSDFVTGGIPVSTNKINVLDLTSFIAPVALKRLNTAPGQPTFDKRWDLIPGRGVFTPMINVTDLTALIAASSGFPPMLGGAKAFSGPACPWPP